MVLCGGCEWLGVVETHGKQLFSLIRQRNHQQLPTAKTNHTSHTNFGGNLKLGEEVGDDGVSEGEEGLLERVQAAHEAYGGGGVDGDEQLLNKTKKCKKFKFGTL